MTMKRLVIPRRRFRLEAFLDALGAFARSRCGYDGPMAVVHGGVAYHDDVELAIALEEDGEIDAGDDIPDDPVGRLEEGLTLFGEFTLFDGQGGFECADGGTVEVPDLDEDDEDEEEPRKARPQRTKNYVEMVGNTQCDECRGYGYLVSLKGDRVAIESALLCDLSGDCEVEPVAEPNLLDGPMTGFVESFVIASGAGED
jgi:hypothetical protein